MGNPVFLIIILFLGFLARSRVVVLASFTLLLLNEMELDSFFSFLSDRGIEIGLIFLLLAILSSLLITSLDWEQLKSELIKREGIIAVFAGVLASRFNGMGLSLLDSSPHLIIGIIIGSLIGVVFFGGIPVGPLMAAGIAAVCLRLLKLVS